MPERVRSWMLSESAHSRYLTRSSRGVTGTVPMLLGSSSSAARLPLTMCSPLCYSLAGQRPTTNARVRLLWTLLRSSSRWRRSSAAVRTCVSCWRIRFTAGISKLTGGGSACSSGTPTATRKAALALRGLRSTRRSDISLKSSRPRASVTSYSTHVVAVLHAVEDVSMLSSSRLPQERSTECCAYANRARR